eukprot:2632372-Prymnesium_polylepis.1
MRDGLGLGVGVCMSSACVATADVNGRPVGRRAGRGDVPCPNATHTRASHPGGWRQPPRRVTESCTGHIPAG